MAWKSRLTDGGERRVRAARGGKQREEEEEADRWGPAGIFIFFSFFFQGCDRICQNFPGSYTCTSCPHDKEFDPTKRRCVTSARKRNLVLGKSKQSNYLTVITSKL